MITVLFFASLKEQLGCDRIDLPCANINTINDIKQSLIVDKPQWSKWLLKPSLLCAKNCAVVNGDCPVTSGDEVAFFPPVTGG
jgi:molybdopterin synthase sulfur carrier subunit